MRLTDSPVRFIQTVLFYAALGAAWNLGNVSYKKISGRSGEKLIVRKTARAVGLGAAAGVLVSIWGDPAEPGNFEIAMGVVTPLADKIANAAETGVETYENADDGDGGKMDEAAVAVVSAVQELQAQDPQDPTKKPGVAETSDEDPRKPDASSQSMPSSVTDEPRNRERPRRPGRADTDDERIESGP